MANETRVTRTLDELGIPYRFFRHPGQVTSLEQAARERNQQPMQVIRTIVFRLAQEEFLVVIVAGAAHISWPALRAYTGRSRLTTADPEEVLDVTGYPIGAVSPIGLPAGMRILVDHSVVQEGEISIGSGERGTTVILLSSDLLLALGDVEQGDFVAKKK